MIKNQIPMAAPYFVELLDRHEQVKTRYRFEKLPINIGRAYANDLILDDANVANYHAIVESAGNGELRLRELGSQQGLVHLGKRISELAVDGHSAVKLGNTQIRIRSASYVEAKQPAKKASLMFDGILPGISGLVMIIISSLVSVWLATADKFSMVSFLFALSMALGVVMLWAGCWAFANRVVSGQARFGRHLFIVSCAVIVIDLWGVLSMLIAYAFSLEFFTAYGNQVTMVLVAVMVFFHLTTISEQHDKRFIGISAALAVIGSGLILMGNYQRSGNLADELYMTHLLPTEFRQSHNQPVDAFIQDANRLKDQLDKARLDKVDGGNNILGQDYQ